MSKIVFFWLALCGMALARQGMAQQAPVAFINEIHNETSQEEEYTEIIVAQDNLDMRGFFIGDNNGTTDSWQPKTEFTSDALWSHLRAGTYIVIYHGRDANCAGVQEDTDGSDGFIRVCAGDTRYFSGGTSTTLSLNSSGDFLHLINPAGTMVQGFGYDSNPGGSVDGGSCFTNTTRWTNTSSAVSNTRPCGKFLFVDSDLANGQSLIQQDSSLTGLAPTPGQFFATISPTLPAGMSDPSEGHGNINKNILLIRRLRQPVWAAQNACTQSTTGSNTFTLSLVSDAYPSDQTLRYIIVRYSQAPTQTDALPDDGISYQPGDRIGTGTVVSNGVYLNSLFTDNYAGVAPTNHYRVFAYRYGSSSGVTTSDRGPSYNETQFATAGPTIVLALQGPASICAGDTGVFTVDYTGQTPISFSSPTPGLGIISNGTTVKVFVSDTSVHTSAFFLQAGFDVSIPECVTQGSAIFTFRRPSLVAVGDTAVDFGDTATIHLKYGGTTITVDPPNILTQLNDSTFRYTDTLSRSFAFTSSSQGNCLASTSYSVRVRPKPVPPIIPVIPPPVALFIPNLVIKSGRSTESKTFRITGARVDRLNIYSRWGSSVLEAVGYDNTWAGISGTYFYFTDLTLPDGTTRQVKGWVEVVD